jgi:hypothetical protein
MVLVNPLHEGFSFYLCEISARVCNVAFTRSLPSRIFRFTRHASHVLPSTTPLLLPLLISQDVKGLGGQ